MILWLRLSSPSVNLFRDWDLFDRSISHAATRADYSRRFCVSPAAGSLEGNSLLSKVMLMSQKTSSSSRSASSWRRTKTKTNGAEVSLLLLIKLKVITKHNVYVKVMTWTDHFGFFWLFFHYTFTFRGFFFLFVSLQCGLLLKATLTEHMWNYAVSHQAFLKLHLYYITFIF